MEEEFSVESTIAVPDLSCPKCDGLLPNALGILACELCGANVEIDHPVTRRDWAEEKVACPNCNSVLLTGVEKRPANVQCSSCDCQFTVTPCAPRAEVQCPSCERRLRLKKRPGHRDITCPACEAGFRVSF